MTSEAAETQVFESSLDDLKNVRELDAQEQALIESIYHFAEHESEWFNLLLGLSKCLSMASNLPDVHPLKGVSERLLAHLRTALNISMRLEIYQQDSDNLDQFWDQIPIGVGILSPDGHIVGMNQRSKDALSNTVDLSISQEHIVYKGECVSSLIEQEISKGSNTLALDVLFDESKKGVLHITPLQSAQTDSPRSIVEAPGMGGAYYFSIVLHNETPLNEKLLREIYHLTDAEFQVLSVMLRELSTSDIAAELAIQPSTVKDHLSSIYEKMNVSRKQDLIRKALFESLIQPQPIDSESDNQSDESFDRYEPRPKTVYLPDGRRLAFTDIQPLKSGMPCRNVLVLHNVMGSCMEIPPEGVKHAREHNIRLIVPERPGYGESDPIRALSYVQWSRDVEALLDHLNLERVYLIGHSIGGSYAMALAEILPDRINRVALVSTVPRISDVRNAKKTPVLLKASLQMIRHAPFLIEPLVRMLIGSDIEKFYRKQLHFVRPQSGGRHADEALIAQETFKVYCLKNFRRSLTQGPSIWAEELRHGFSEWEFNVSDQNVEYRMWHGTSDDVVTVEMVESLAVDLNVSQFHCIENETHLLFHRKFVQIINDLVSEAVADRRP